MLTVLFLGLLVGLRHALEADHIAAVTSLATGAHSVRERVRVAALWGSGHAAALILLGGGLVALGTTLPDAVARGFEVVAGCVLVALGIGVLRRLRARRIHFHVHEHGDGVRHLHAHAHHAHGAHDAAAHRHAHRRLLPRAMLVGSLHGLAGSGALVILSMQLLGAGWLAVAYVVCFAAGSILGMVAFSLALTMPLALSPRLLERVAVPIEALAGVATIAIGCWMAVEAAAF
jgi:hypothetical protein